MPSFPPEVTVVVAVPPIEADSKEMLVAVSAEEDAKA